MKHVQDLKLVKVRSLISEVRTKVPSEKHIYCDQTFQFNSCKCKFGMLLKEKTSKVWFRSKVKAGWAANLTREMTDF